MRILGWVEDPLSGGNSRRIKYKPAGNLGRSRLMIEPVPTPVSNYVSRRALDSHSSQLQSDLSGKWRIPLEWGCYNGPAFVALVNL